MESGSIVVSGSLISAAKAINLRKNIYVTENHHIERIIRYPAIGPGSTILLRC